MSKEQTPIEEYNKNLIQVIRNGVDIEDYILRNMLDEKRKQEQYANAKVLEALERDLKDLSECYKAHAEDNPKKEVCQVLHTLIMEKQEQIAQTKKK
jgi:hypothetical protein